MSEGYYAASPATTRAPVLGSVNREARTLAWLRLHPDGSTVPVHDFLAGGQADTRSRVFVAMQAFEDAENLRLIFRWNSDAVVFHRKNPIACPASAAVTRDARRLFGAVFQCIADEVLEYLRQVQRVGRHDGERPQRDCRRWLSEMELCRLLIASLTTLSTATGSSVASPTSPEREYSSKRFHQRVHALRPSDGHVEQLPCLLVQNLSGIAVADELQIVGDGPQRFLQIVRRGVGELLQVLIGSS